MECWPWLPRERGKAARHVFAGKQTSRTNRKHTRSTSCRPSPGPPALTGDPFPLPRRDARCEAGRRLGFPRLPAGWAREGDLLSPPQAPPLQAPPRPSPPRVFPTPGPLRGRLSRPGGLLQPALLSKAAGFSLNPVFSKSASQAIPCTEGHRPPPPR